MWSRSRPGRRKRATGNRQPGDGNRRGSRSALAAWLCKAKVVRGVPSGNKENAPPGGPSGAFHIGARRHCLRAATREAADKDSDVGKVENPERLGEVSDRFMVYKSTHERVDIGEVEHAERCSEI